MSRLNPCLSCGACCAFYRASFYWSEADDAPFGTVPADKTEPLGPFRRVMIGTTRKMSRCICLQGDIGIHVYCDIYDRRSSVCRDFDASWINGMWNERCDKARIAWGLEPLTPDSFNDPGNDPGHLPRAA
ncbi:YkgJ family cysteine cluster protein [Desulfatiferula olefinivorans]